MTTDIEAITRVISEQQDEIDRLKRIEKSNDEAGGYRMVAEEKFMRALFKWLKDIRDNDARLDFFQAIHDFGWCRDCKSSPCRCDE